MASTNFTDTQTVIVAEWLNEVNTLVHSIGGNATTRIELLATLLPGILDNSSANSITINADGTLSLAQDAVMADGKGVDFSALTGGSVAGTTTKQILTDYEEGTWVPVLSAGGSDLSLGTALGYYTKIGRLVHFNCQIAVSNVGIGTGGLVLSGLPYPAGPGVNAGGGLGKTTTLNITAGQSLTWNTSNNSSAIYFSLWDSAGGTSSLQKTAILVGSQFLFSGEYST